MKQLFLLVFGLLVLTVNLAAQSGRSSTGIWQIREFVDEFGDKTGEKYISIMEKGGLVRVSISIESINTYRFDIPNADGFDRAFSQIGGVAEAAAPPAQRSSGYRSMGAEETWTVR